MKGRIVVYESTVYISVTKDNPILEKGRGQKCVEVIKIRYCPKRINLGDKAPTLNTILRLYSGWTNRPAMNRSKHFKDNLIDEKKAMIYMKNVHCKDE